MANPNKLSVAPGGEDTTTLPTALLERLTATLERLSATPLATAVADDARVLAALHGLKVEAAAQIEWFVAASARAVAALAALVPDASEVEAPDVGALLADAIKNARPSLEPRGNKSAAAEDAAAKGSITQAGLEGLLSGLLSGK
jgi:hypothetical protein